MLAPKTTMQIGGAARYFIEVQHAEEVKEAYVFARERDLPHKILGGGSNVLVPDEGFHGVVLHLSGRGITKEGSVFRVQAGEILLDVIRFAAKAGLGDWESLAGIPGTMGGAVRGNAGAFGSEIKDVLLEVRAVNLQSGEEKVFTNAECEFSYRMSFFKTRPEWVIIEATVQLAQSAETEKKIEHTLAEREKRHIQNIKSAGSFFMNPIVSRELQELFEKEKDVSSKEGRVPAGWLMDKAGLRGARVGGAVASPHHTNYFLNDGDATAADVLALATLAKEKVYAEFDVVLGEEAVVW